MVQLNIQVTDELYMQLREHKLALEMEVQKRLTWDKYILILHDMAR